MKNLTIINFIVQVVALLLLLPQSTNAFVSPNARVSNAHAPTDLYKLSQGTLATAAVDTDLGKGATCISPHSPLFQEASALSNESGSLNPIKAALTKVSLESRVQSIAPFRFVSRIPNER